MAISGIVNRKQTYNVRRNNKHSLFALSISVFRFFLSPSPSPSLSREKKRIYDVNSGARCITKCCKNRNDLTFKQLKGQRKKFIPLKMGHGAASTNVSSHKMSQVTLTATRDVCLCLFIQSSRSSEGKNQRKKEQTIVHSNKKSQDSLKKRNTAQCTPPHTTYYILHTTYYILHATCYILHTLHTLHTTHTTLQAQYTEDTLNRLHIEY